MGNPVILIVDDDPMVAEVLQGYLEECIQGHEFVLKGTCDEGLEYVRAADLSHLIAAILDDNLGNERRGVEIANFLAKEKAAGRFSGQVYSFSSDDRERFSSEEQTCFDEFFVKPSDFNKLCGRVCEVCR